MKILEGGKIMNIDRNMNAARSQSGFTIIELVVVILLLGILAATALPRFMDVTDSAHESVMRGVVGGISTGTGLFHAQWVGNGALVAYATLANFGNLSSKHNPTGYPVGDNTDGVMTRAECGQVFSDLLQGGRPTFDVTLGSVGEPITVNAYSQDFEVAVSDTKCYYIYTAQGATVSSPFMILDTDNGDITFDFGTKL